MTDSSTASIEAPTPGTYRIDPTKSQVLYSGKHMFGLGTVHATLITLEGGELQIASRWQPPARPSPWTPQASAQTTPDVTRTSGPPACWTSKPTPTSPSQPTTSRRLYLRLACLAQSRPPAE